MTINDAGTPPVGSADAADLGDADLVLRTRSGDTAAFGELWRRHYRSGVTVARSVTSSLDPDDLVQESYTRIYQSIVAGGGPTGSFRAYLFTSIRNTAATWGRARRETAIDALDAIEDPATSDQATDDALDRSLTHRAFRSLPTRWQEVLWYSEIEQMKPAEIAPLLGMKATAVAQLTFRAREGLREAWIQAHLRSVVDGSPCQWTIEHLGAYSRANLGRRDRARLEAHLASCARCAIVASEAKEVSGRLALVLLPLTVGAVGTAGYLASLQGGVPAIALAAMPSSVMQGAVTILPGMPDIATLAMGAGGAGTAVGTAGGTMGVAAGGTMAAAGAGSTGVAAAGSTAAGTAAAGAAGSAAAAGITAAAGATAAATAGVAATAAAAGGILSGVGAMAGLAAAGVVMATVVAAMVFPGPGPSATVADEVGSSIVIEEGNAEAPPASTTSNDDLPVDTVDPIAPATGEGDASDSADAPVTQAAEGAAQPEHPAAPAPAPPVQAQGNPNPGTPPQGNPNPGTPPQGNPNPGGQGQGNPSPAVPRANLPDGSPAVIGSTSYTTQETGQLNIEVVVSGVPGATAQARIRGALYASAVIGGDGTATLVLRPSEAELRGEPRVELRYVDGNLMGPPTVVLLSDLL